MAFTIVRPDEPIPPRPLVVTIYGDPGLGKTSLSQTANAPLTFDFDKGIQRAINRKNFVGFDSWEDVEAFINSGELDRITPKIETIICDTAGAMLDDFIGSYAQRKNEANKQKGGGLSLKGYGAVKDIFNEFVMNELRRRNIDLVIIAHAVESDNDGSKTFRPKLTGGSKDILIQKSDLLGYMYMDNGKRTLNFNPTDRWIGKNSPEFPPIVLKANGEEGQKTQLADIIKEAKERISKMTTEQEESLKFLNEKSEQILACADIVEIDALSEEIDKLDLAPVYKAQLDKIKGERYKLLFKVEFIDPKTTAEEFNAMLTFNYPKRYEKDLKTILINEAKEKGLGWDGEKKVFTNPPAPEPEKADDKKEAGKTKEKTV